MQLIGVKLKMSYLDAGFSQVYFHGDLLPGVNVRVVCLLEGALQLLQLGGSESCPDAALLPLLGQHALVPRVHLVG